LNIGKPNEQGLISFFKSIFRQPDKTPEYFKEMRSNTYGKTIRQKLVDLSSATTRINKEIKGAIENKTPTEILVNGISSVTDNIQDAIHDLNHDLNTSTDSIGSLDSYKNGKTGSYASI
jgi:hypothetical protein